MNIKQPTNIKQLTAARDCESGNDGMEDGCLLDVPQKITVFGGGFFCISCGKKAVLKNYDGQYCRDCMQFHLLEKMFVSLSSLQGRKL